MNTSTLSPATQPFAVLGHPIRHSLSPVMHNAAFEALGLDAVYLAFDAHPDRLLSILAAMADMGFVGVNLTIPLKEVAFRGLDQLHESARQLRSVNTVKCSAGRLEGFSTDGDGFLMALNDAFGITPKDRSVFIAGCGGAGRAVAIACALAGAQRIVLANRHVDRAQRLADEIRALPRSVAVEIPGPTEAEWTAACRTTDLVIQCSSVGMHAGDVSLLRPAAFRPEQHAYDLIYTFPETVFMAAARAGGARAANGLGMLLFQGALSFQIWTGRPAPTEAMRQALVKAVYGKADS